MYCKKNKTYLHILDKNKIKNYIDGAKLFNDDSILYYSCKTCKAVWELKNKKIDNSSKKIILNENNNDRQEIFEASVVESLTERMIVSPKIDDLYLFKDLLLIPKIILKKVFDILKEKYPDKLRTIYEKNENMHYYIEELLSKWYSLNP